MTLGQACEGWRAAASAQDTAADVVASANAAAVRAARAAFSNSVALPSAAEVLGELGPRARESERVERGHQQIAVVERAGRDRARRGDRRLPGLGEHLGHALGDALVAVTGQRTATWTGVLAEFHELGQDGVK